MNDIVNPNPQQPNIAKNAPKKCQHGKRNDFCRECKKLGIGGASICDHDCRRHLCRKCKKLGIGGASVCDHDRRRNQCAECNGPGICLHKRVRTLCIQCNGGQTCVHKRRRTYCIDCKRLGIGGTGICIHDCRRSKCKECHGTEVCVHKRARDRCIDCKRLGVGGSGLCIHERENSKCTSYPCYLTATSICQICFNHYANNKYTVDGIRSCARCFHTYFKARLGECATTADRLAILRKPSNRRIKEIRIAGDVVAAFGDRGWDFQGYTADCDDTLGDDEAELTSSETKGLGGFTRLKWYFTDMESFIEDGNTILVVEIDEHEHKQYPVTCEYNRMLGVVAAHRGKRVLFARFNPDEWSLNGQQIASTFTKNADGIFEPNDLYEPSIDYFTQCIRELCSGSLLRLDDHDGLMGVMYVNYSIDSAAVAYSTEQLGSRNVVVKNK